MRRTQLPLAALLTVGSLTLAACGGSGSGSMDDMPGMGSSATDKSASAPMAADFNDADATFATEMIPHHRQAVEMAKLAHTRTKDPKVMDLAMKIEAAQDPEIETMTGWLKDWGKPVPEDMSGMDMSGSMPGMMSDSDMTHLEGMSGAEFDTMFLQMMIKHHQGAITMAKTEISTGKNADATSLARSIETAQTAEIAQMRTLLKK